jgi:hypothetical protein
MDRAIVVDVRDPSKRGRIKVQIPTKTGKKSTDWIWPVVSSGFLVLPKPGDQVWVLYESGDDNYPIWLGKTETTKSYKNANNRDLRNVSLLLERVRTLEEKVKDLEDEVKTLGNTKANVSHSH